jgi:hypothetical protein
VPERAPRGDGGLGVVGHPGESSRPGNARGAS